MIKEVQVLGLDDRLPLRPMHAALELVVLDRDLESKLILLELPPDAAGGREVTPVGDQPATGATCCPS